jgi:putative hydrolase of the HAD superfamily
MVYGSYSLDAANPAITRALIMVHGAGRNADHYFETSMAAAFLAGAIDNTIVLAPHFIAGNDKPQANEILWPERGDNWRSGGMSPTLPTVSSFDFLDEMIRKLADKKTFPNLTKIVVAGHSAGGQVATRYEMINRVHDTKGVSISYVVANPSSYAWPAAVRPLPTGDADPVDAYKASLEPNGEKVHSSFTYGAFDATKAPNYNKWPAGLENITGYAARSTVDQIKKKPRRAADHVPPRPGRRSPARRLRLVAECDGSGSDAPRTRRSVLQVRQRDARREAQRDHRSRVRPQRSVHLHDRHRVPGPVPQVNVVFDLGGVLLSWNPQEMLEKSFADPAVREIARREVMMHPDWLEIDRGTYTFDQAIERFVASSGLSRETIQAFMDSVPHSLTAKPESVDLLHRVKAAGNSVYCLSNMPHETFDFLERNHDFWHAFDGLVISARVGFCKPEAAIYHHLLETFELVPSETVFIDDMPENIEAAKREGIHGIRFETAAQVETELRRLGAL